MHPIIPAAEAHIGIPLAYVEALAMLEDVAIPDDLFELIDDASDVGEHEQILFMALTFGSLRGFVYSPTQVRWGRLPAAFWAWHC